MEIENLQKYITVADKLDKLLKEIYGYTRVEAKKLNICLVCHKKVEFKETEIIENKHYQASGKCIECGSFK